MCRECGDEMIHRVTCHACGARHDPGPYTWRLAVWMACAVACLPLFFVVAAAQDWRQ